MTENVNWEQNARDLAKVRETLYVALEKKQARIAELETAYAWVKGYTGYLENGMPADEPSLECTKCGAYYFHDLGGKSLCGDCLEALADHCERLEAKIDRAMTVNVYPFAGDLGDGYPYGWDDCRDEFRALLTGESTPTSEGGAE